MDISKLKVSREDKTALDSALQELYQEDIEEYVRQCGDNEKFRFDSERQWKILDDCIKDAGAYNQGYFFQDMWAAREIYRSNKKHVYDIGSRVDGYVTHLLSMEVKVTLLDIRPMDRKIEGIEFIQTDAMNMSNIASNSIETLSALCSLEHFGLGRYSDPIDYDGWKKALHEIKRVLKVGGTFYLSVPVAGSDSLVFHAHRIFHPATIVDELTPELKLHEFSWVENWQIITGFEWGGVDITAAELDFLAKKLPVLKKNGVMGLFKFKKHFLT